MIIQHRLLWTLCAVVSVAAALPLHNSSFLSSTTSKSESAVLPHIVATSNLINESEVLAYIGYPEIAFNAGIQGEVTFMVLTDSNGNYLDHKVLDSFHPLLRIPCEKNLSLLAFQPMEGAKNGTPYWNKVTFVFSLPKYAK